MINKPKINEITFTPISVNLKPGSDLSSVTEGKYRSFGPESEYNPDFEPNIDSQPNQDDWNDRPVNRETFYSKKSALSSNQATAMDSDNRGISTNTSSQTSRASKFDSFKFSGSPFRSFKKFS